MTVAYHYDAGPHKFKGKERDGESGLDDFDARYYSSSMGRFMSPDWSESPEAVPYGVLSNPQTLNLYAYVKNNPLKDTDPTGHSGDDDIVDHILNFVVSAGTTWLSDNAFGAFRPKPNSVEGQLGQAVGDFAAQQSGIAETEAGAAGLTDSGVMALVPGGQEAAAGDAVVSGAAVLHGTATATIATANLAKDANLTSSGGPKANDAAGVTAGGQATDKYGNKLGPSGEPQVNKTTSNTREGARNKALKEGSGAVEHRTPKRGGPHFHPTDNKGKKKPSSTHHEYAD
jgi:RHS repeat-associated protein